MNQTTFEQMDLSQEILSAIDHMGFTNATDIQAQSIPLIQEGFDVIGRSQTGTGKTVAFGIPAIEKVDRTQKNSAQVLIMCPTRELAMQACGEINKLSRYADGISALDIYGGASMQQQITGLKNANIVIGTPGRIMDHLRRKTLKLHSVKMVVLDEADEMLSMGFRDDIETILNETPEERQTVLFSATMPKEIIALTKKYQKEPQMVSINEKQVTVENISQYYYDVPSSLKKEALDVLLKYHNPAISLVFCNTKRMVDDVVVYLNKKGYRAEGLHGDFNQPQRTKTMEAFKSGRTSVLVATDVAARGIDVKNIEFVINYDVPQNTEYYVHRIGRTGRAGKAGSAITLCCGRRQSEGLKQIGRQAKSEILFKKMPTAGELGEKLRGMQNRQIEDSIQSSSGAAYTELVAGLMEKGYDAAAIAAAVLEMHFGKPDTNAGGNLFEKSEMPKPKYQKMVLNIGRQSRVSPGNIVGAITQYAGIQGQDIGRIDIMDKQTIVMVAEDKIRHVIASMTNCKINGSNASASLCGFSYESNSEKNYSGYSNGSRAKAGYGRSGNKGGRQYGKPAPKRKDKLFVEYC